MKKLIVFSSLVIAFIFFYGCDRDNVVDDANSKNISNNLQLQYNNSNNPLDSIGIMHNNTLYDFYYNNNNKIIYQNNIVDLKKTDSVLNIFILDYFKNNFNYNLNSFYYPYGANSILISEKTDSIFNSVNNLVVFSQEFKNKITNYYNQLKTIIENSDTPDSIYNFVDLEISSIKNNNTLTENEKKCLFSVLSVEEHSTFLWYTYCTDNQNKGNSICHLSKKTRRAIAHIVSADFVGAYFGFLWGAFLGAGTPAAMAGGAAIGAARASGTAALKYLF